MKLYEITSTIDHIMADVEQAEADGDTARLEALGEALSDWTGDLDAKICAIVGTREELLVEASARKDVSKRQLDRANALEKRAAWLESYAISGMHAAGRNDIDKPEMRVRLKVGTGAVEVTREDDLPAIFWREIPATKTVDKAELRAALMIMKNKGETPVLPGARLVFSESIKVN
jgi:hypothetical protein